MSKGERRSKTKCLAYIAAFIVFQTTVILVFVLTIMKNGAPNVRFNAIAVEGFSSNTTNSPSINLQLLTQISIKNTNFGQFKYENSTLTILYNGMPVGEALIPRWSSKARTTKKFNVSVGVSSGSISGNTNLGNDIKSGILRLSSDSKLSGKVHLMKVIKKKKSGELNCDWSINLATRVVHDLKCK